MQCLRGVSPTALLALHTSFDTAFPAAAFGTPVIPLEPSRAITSGAVARIPVMSGHTHDEARLLAAIAELLQSPITNATYPALVAQSFGARAAEVLSEYPVTQYPAAALAWSAMDTDRVFACTQLRVSRALAARMPTYAYEFADPDAPPLTSIPFPPDVPPGASHGSELAYLFNLPGSPDSGFTDQQQQLGTTMIEYWTQFAHTGQPGAPGAPPWPAWDVRTTTPYVQSLAPGPGGIHPVDDAADHHCGFWDSFSERSNRGGPRER
jgi:para-nitrobenzyl esterase